MKVRWIYKIYISDKNKPYACVEQINKNVNESHSILKDTNCQKIACKINQGHFDEIDFTTILFTMNLFIIFTISMTKSSMIT